MEYSILYISYETVRQNYRCARGWGQRESRGIRRFPAGMGMNVEGIRGMDLTITGFRGDGYYMRRA